jgi:hypothetical protein
MSNRFVNYSVLCTFVDCRDQLHESLAEASNFCLASYFRNPLVDRQSSEVSVAGSTCISALKPNKGAKLGWGAHSEDYQEGQIFRTSGLRIGLSPVFEMMQ